MDLVCNNSNTLNCIYCRCAALCPQEMQVCGAQNLTASDKVECNAQIIGQSKKS